MKGCFENSEGRAHKLKRREKRKKIADTKLKVCLPHVPSRNGMAANRFWMLPYKPPFGLRSPLAHQPNIKATSYTLTRAMHALTTFFNNV